MTNRIIESSERDYQETEEYYQKANAVKNEVIDKYRSLIQSENSFFKKIILQIKMKFEIRQRIRKLCPNPVTSYPGFND